MGSLPSYLVGLEAFGGSYHWARQLKVLGCAIKWMNPQHVKP